VPTQALVNQGGGQGVYIRTPLGIKFVGVQVIGALGNSVAVQGGVQIGEDVVTNPNLVTKIDQKI